MPSKSWPDPNVREILVSTILYVVGVFNVVTYEGDRLVWVIEGNYIGRTHYQLVV